MSSAIFAFFHHVLAFALVAAIVTESALIREPLSRGLVKKLVVVDSIDGVSALLLLLVGFTRVYAYEKGPDYYFASASFEMKMTLFIVAGLISIYPTVTFFRWRKALKNREPDAVMVRQQKRIKILLTLELLAIVGVLFYAALMARGL